MEEHLLLMLQESIHSSFKKILPSLDFNIPVITLHKVDFPAPLFPRTARISPLLRWKDTFSKVFLFLS